MPVKRSNEEDPVFIPAGGRALIPKDAFGWPILAGFARVGLLSLASFFEGLPVVSVRAKKGGVWRVAYPKRNRLHRLSQVSGKGAGASRHRHRGINVS
jgi:hypothetical protein